jgi:hypothetical protein
MEGQQVNISGLDKVELLRRLWTNMKPAAFYTTIPRPIPEFDTVLAQEAVLSYIDYFCGRCIQCDLSGNTVNTKFYDRDAGRDSFARIVAIMRVT